MYEYDEREECQTSYFSCDYCELRQYCKLVDINNKDLSELFGLDEELDDYCRANNNIPF